MRILVNILIILFLMATLIYADTVIMKDGKEAKGLIVDEYTDRITLSTVDGERSISRCRRDRKT